MKAKKLIDIQGTFVNSNIKRRQSFEFMKNIPVLFKIVDGFIITYMEPIKIPPGYEPEKHESDVFGGQI
jgi:hypothetical protein